MENFLKRRPVAPLASCKRSVMEVFNEIDDFFSLFITLAETLRHDSQSSKCAAVESNLFDILLLTHCKPFKYPGIENWVSWAEPGLSRKPSS